MPRCWLAGKLGGLLRDNTALQQFLMVVTWRPSLPLMCQHAGLELLPRQHAGGRNHLHDPLTFISRPVAWSPCAAPAATSARRTACQHPTTRDIGRGWIAEATRPRRSNCWLATT